MGMKRILFLLLIAVIGFCSPAAAQSTAGQEKAADQQEINASAEYTREELRSILNQYPNAVGEILRRDPSLMARTDYMAAYPKLQDYLARHPEIARNVEYYFEGYGSWGERRQPVNPNFEALGVLLGGMAGVFVLIVFLSTMVWLVRSFIQHRRWLKQSQVQTEVHTKLMDRMTSNEELIAYIQSPAGRRFLEAGPVRAEETPSISAPIGSIIWSLMAGIVLTAVGLGFRYSANVIKDEAHDAFLVVGMIIIALGAGFILASLMAFIVSSRLGLFPQRTPQESQSGNA